jgi:hypothetical protein
MADTNSQPDGQAFVESDGINYRGIVLFVAILAITTFICQGIVVVMFKYFDKAVVSAGPARATMEAPAGTLPPPPNLLTDEPLNLKNFRDHEADVLGTYAWQDQNAGVVRLPIERAKELVLERGFPVAGEAPAAAPKAEVKKAEIKK